MVLCACSLSFSLSQTMVVPLIPLIRDRVGASETGAAWVLTVNLLAAAVLSPLIGRLGDVGLRRQLLLTCLASLVVGGAVCASASTLPVLLVGRGIQAFGSGLLPLAFALLREHETPRRLAGSLATVASMVGVGWGTGIVLAGPLVSIGGQAWQYLLPASLAGAACVAGWWIVPSQKASAEEGALRSCQASVPVVSVVLFTIAMVSLLLALSRAGERGDDFMRSAGLVSLGLLVGALWIRRDLRVREPFVDLRLMASHRVLWVAGVMAVLCALGTYGNFAYSPQLLQTPVETGFGFGLSPTQAGLVILPSAVANFAAGLGTGRLLGRWSGRRVLGLSGAVSAASLVGLALAHQSIALVLAWNLAAGAAFGVFFVALTHAVVAGAPDRVVGSASGVNVSLRTIGGAMGSALTATVVAASAVGGQAQNSGYVACFLLLAGLTALGAVLALLLPGPRATPRRP